MQGKELYNTQKVGDEFEAVELGQPKRVRSEPCQFGESDAYSMFIN